jgi:glutathione S-transferase
MKLTYFDVRGLAETSRLILAYNNVEYEDFRYPLKVNDWKTHDMTKVEFDLAKTNGELKRSMNKVPFLEVEGQVICQSKAIERYLGRTLGMMGSTELEGAMVDSICEVVRDVKDMYQGIRRLPEEEKKEGMVKWFAETMPNKLSDLEHILGDVDGYSVGNSTSLSDIVLFSLLTQFFDDKDSARKSLTHNSKLRSIVMRIESHPNILNWLDSRPETSF